MISIAHIQAAVCRRYNVGLADLLSDRREQAIVRPRHVAMWLARRLTRKSCAAIGRAFGNRDHTSIHSALARVEARMAAGESGDIWALLAELQTPLPTVWPQTALAHLWITAATSRSREIAA
jgi:chromosomal replication initiator protein